MSKFDSYMPKVLAALNSLCKHIAVGIAYTIVEYLFFFFTSNYTYTAGEAAFWMAAILTVSYVSTAFAFAVYNKLQCLQFLDKNTRDVFSEIRSFTFLIDQVFAIIFFVILSFKVLSPIPIVAAAIANPLFFIFARRLWLRDAENKHPAHLYTAKLALHYVLSIPALFLLFLFSSSFIPAIPTLLMVGRLLSYLLIFPILLAVFLYIRAFVVMGKFLRSFRAFCKANHIKEPKIRSPYLAIFRTDTGRPFEIEIHGKVYACSIVSFVNIFKPVIFKTDGFYYRISARAMKHNIKPSFTFETSYGYKSDRPKLLLIISEPYVIKIQEGTQSKFFDTGDSCGEYKIFTPKGFFGAAERNTIGRKRFD